tara:strand:- start:222 stop:731 length:510 start_codon:yes stop_codon:yes gene_type:complete
MKCISCEEKIKEDYYNYTSTGEVLCEGCYSDDLNDPIATVIDNQGGKHYKTNYNTFDEYGENYGIPDKISEYLESVNYTRSDGWRGFYTGQAPKGYETVKNTWFCGFDGANMDNLMSNLNEIIEKDTEYLSNFDYFLSILRTSNLFSSGFELYVKKDQVKEFVESVNAF